MDLPLLAELQRRRVFRALVGYGIAAFAVLQIIEPVMHGLHWPDAVLSYVVVALAAGFPVVVALGWIFDVNAGRIERTPGSAQMKGARLALVSAGIGLLSAAPGLGWYFVLRPRQQPAMASESERSIAVLPFTSLTAGDENRYFADAIHIELLGQLAKVGDLSVISRTSVLQYKEGARNLREIGEALGVSSVLEGSVQRAGNRVRIQVQLVDAKSDRQLWADRYDRELTDLFLIQTAVAEEIAKALHARLLPEERDRIARRPTGNAEAYTLYLKGCEILSRPTWAADSPIAEPLFRRAVELDPSFALAHAQLSFVDGMEYWFNLDHTGARLKEAREEAERALGLQPDLGEAHFALGMVYYWGSRDYDHALQEFEIARRSMPAVVEYMAYVQRRQGHFEEARRNLLVAIRLDPRDARVQVEYLNNLLPMRNYEEAAAAIPRLATVAPDWAKIAEAYLAMLWKGDTEPGKAVVRDLGHSSAATWTAMWKPSPFLSELLEVVPHETLDALPAAPSLLADSMYYRPRPLLIALARGAVAGAAQAAEDYKAARVELEEAVSRYPEDAIRHTALARTYAGLGRRADALREARRAVEILPISKDALLGPELLEELAAVEAQTGDADAAVDVLHKLLSIPSRTSAALFRIHPKWASLRGNARFQALVGRL